MQIPTVYFNQTVSVVQGSYYIIKLFSALLLFTGQKKIVATEGASSVVEGLQGQL